MRSGRASSPEFERRPPLIGGARGRWAWELVREVIDEYRADGVGDVAAAITFWTILSVPAAALAFVSVLSSLESVVGASVAADVEVAVRDFVADTFADSTALTDTVDELFSTSSRGLATAATLVAMFTLSRAFAGLIRALDIAYEVEEGRPWWYVRLVAVGLGVGTVVVVAASATILAVLPSLPYDGVVRVLAVPLVVLAMVAWAATVFHIGPNHRTPWRYDLPGAVLTALGWIAATQAFALYVRVAERGNQVQSGVGAILLALTLMHLLGIVLLVGAELNDVLARRAGIVEPSLSMTARARRARARLRRRDQRPEM